VASLTAMGRTELRQLAEVAEQLLGPALPDGYLVVVVRAATCHPDRRMDSRGLCESCYTVAQRTGTLHRHAPVREVRSRADFVADYSMLRSEGHSRAQIAERLGMRYTAVTSAYLAAVRAGDLTPDPDWMRR
jgi:hypothetical protein